MHSFEHFERHSASSLVQSYFHHATLSSTQKKKPTMRPEEMALLDQINWLKFWLVNDYHLSVSSHRRLKTLPQPLEKRQNRSKWRESFIKANGMIMCPMRGSTRKQLWVLSSRTHNPLSLSFIYNLLDGEASKDRITAQTSQNIFKLIIFKWGLNCEWKISKDQSKRRRKTVSS